MHADLIELVPHERMAGHRREVFPVHDRRNMMGRNAAPVGDAGGAVLVASGIPPIWISLGVSDQNRHI